MANRKKGHTIKIKPYLSELEEFFLSEEPPVIVAYQSYAFAETCCQRLGTRGYIKDLKEAFDW